MAIPKKLKVPTLYKAYFLGLFFREYPHTIWPNIWYVVYVPPSFLDPEDLPLIHGYGYEWLLGGSSHLVSGL